MVVCYKKKCIFVHIPKTAGTSIEQFLRDRGKNHLDFFGVHNNRSLQHLTAIELKKIVPIYNTLYKFSMVRNPYDRLLSEYYWTNIPNMGHKYGKTKDQFLQKVINIVINNKYFEHRDNDHFIPQYNFVFNNNELIVDEVFQYEKLKDATNYLKKKLGININFPYLNKTSATKKDQWTDKQKEIIYKLYNKDFIIFRYDK